MPPTTRSTTTSTATAVDRTRIRRLARTGGLATAVLVAAVTGSLATTAVAGERLFTDVGPDHPFAGDIDFVADADIAEGFADGTYRPNEPVSRQAMAAFLRRSSAYRIESRIAGASNSAVFSSTVGCGREGEVAISGGAVYQGPGRAFISSTGPTSNGEWRTTMTTDDGVAVTGSISAFAICAPGQMNPDDDL